MKILFIRGKGGYYSNEIFDYNTLYIVDRFKGFQYIFLVRDKNVSGNDINEYLKKNLTCDYFIALLNYDITSDGNFFEQYFGKNGLFVGLTDREESIAFSLKFGAERII